MCLGPSRPDQLFPLLTQLATLQRVELTRQGVPLRHAITLK